ncbi:MAG TPA: hypothetical protein VFB96_17985, partial [Pirellulaceae bacterium]|nr:hypothetical protein [Pirellulaceae bacterium]
MARTLSVSLWLAAVLALAGCNKPTVPVPPAIPSGIGALEPATPEGNLSLAPGPVAPAPVAPPPAGGSMPAPLTSISPPMDLLKEIDASRDARSGTWTTRDGALISPATPAAALQILYQPPPAYRWTVVAQRLSGSESLNLGFVIEQRPAMCALEGWGQKLSGLSLLDGQTGDNNATTVRQPVLVEGRPNTIVLTVRPSRVVCEVNGRTIIDWTGSPQQLSLDRRYWDKVGGGQLFLGSWGSSYAISKCQVEVLPLSEALASRNPSAASAPATSASPTNAARNWPVPSGWEKLEDAANGFRVAFPVKPFNQPQSAGVQYLAEHDNMAFSAQMVPAESRGAREDVVLSRLCQQTFNTGEHRLLTVGTPTHDGKKWALLAVARDDEGQIYTIRMYLKSGRLFTAFVLTDAGDERQP